MVMVLIDDDEGLKYCNKKNVMMMMMMTTNHEFMFHVGNYEYRVDNGDDHEEEEDS